MLKEFAVGYPSLSGEVRVDAYYLRFVLAHAFDVNSLKQASNRYVSIRQHTSAYVSIRQHRDVNLLAQADLESVSIKALSRLC
jgi:hypothetical protein